MNSLWLLSMDMLTCSFAGLFLWRTHCDPKNPVQERAEFSVFKIADSYNTFVLDLVDVVLRWKCRSIHVGLFPQKTYSGTLVSGFGLGAGIKYNKRR